jgi:anaerobic selenocysteine-containing dehydrogenase
MGWYVCDREYKKYEKDGFKTPSAKVELYSEQLKKWGHDPLPVYYEPPETPYSAPDMLKEYPLIFTSWHPEVYHHSDNRQIASLRVQDPVPVIELHPKTAAGLGIKEGDMAYVETKRGRCKLRVKLVESIDPLVVAAEIDWWFPEQGVDTLHGYRESNVNMITDDQPPFNPELGSSSLRGFLCKVYKAS